MSLNKKILVLGANGLLGCELLNKEYPENWELVGHFGRSKEHNADLSDQAQTLRYLNNVMPDVIINLVALTDVDYCEQYPNESYLGNVKVVENIAYWIKQHSKKVQLIQISTDQVYDGQGPHIEEQVTLKNYYAFSKYAGELAAHNVEATVLRTNFFGKSKTEKRASFTDWLYEALNKKEPIKVFEDVYFSPLSMDTLTSMIIAVIEKDISGVYNLGSRQGLSKAEFAFEFAQALKQDTNNVTRTTIDAVDFVKTYRPKDMRLDVSKLEQALDLVLPTLHQEIQKVSQEYTR